jgi:hypothetical protein
MKVLVRLSLPALVVIVGLGTTAQAGGHEVPAATSTSSDGLPEAVVYRQIFRHVLALQQDADALEKKGEDASRQRSFYKKNAGLTDEEDAILTGVAKDCLAEVTRQDQEAYRLIRAVRSQVPNGVVAIGQVAPPPPAELSAMQEERDAITLRARDRLRSELGDQPFERFAQFVRTKIAPQIQRIAVARPRPAGPRTPMLLPPNRPSVTTPPQ